MIDMNRTIIVNQLYKVNRPGIDQLIEFLINSDFFTAPASTKYHGNFEGGLAEHSLHVYEAFKELNSIYLINIPEETVLIATLLHDVCKINFYTKEQKWRKDDKGKWEGYSSYCVKDEFPYGHGEKSVSILQDFIKLTDEEKMLLRWHMGAWEPQENRLNLHAAVSLYPQIKLMNAADELASIFKDKKVEV